MSLTGTAFQNALIHWYRCLCLWEHFLVLDKSEEQELGLFNIFRVHGCLSNTQVTSSTAEYCC